MSDAILQWNERAETLLFDPDDEVLLHIPRIVWVQLGETLHTAALWPAGLPMVMPQVEVIVLIGGALDEKPVARWIFLSDLEHLLERYPLESHPELGVQFRRLSDDPLPTQIMLPINKLAWTLPELPDGALKHRR